MRSDTLRQNLDYYHTACSLPEGKAIFTREWQSFKRILQVPRKGCFRNLRRSKQVKDKPFRLKLYRLGRHALEPWSAMLGKGASPSDGHDDGMDGKDPGDHLGRVDLDDPSSSSRPDLSVAAIPLKEKLDMYSKIYVEYLQLVIQPMRFYSFQVGGSPPVCVQVLCIITDRPCSAGRFVVN